MRMVEHPSGIRRIFDFPSLCQLAHDGHENRYLVNPLLGSGANQFSY